MRVLIVGNAGERYPGQRFYSVERKLANGFTRNGHSVYFFSDRDVARNGTLFRSSRAGRGVANRMFLETVRNFEPEAIVFAHSSLLATETFAAAKATRTKPRLAQFCVDPLFRTINVEFLTDRARIVDATFVTTAGAALAQFATASNVSAFIPNPVDASVDAGRAFERSDQPFDVFFAANAGGDRPDEARRVTPRLFAGTPGLNCAIFGFDGAPGVYGAAYFRHLLEARMALNLNSDRGEPALERAPAEELYLYNSDRISQLTGCGLLALSYRINCLMELYDEDRQMVFSDTPEEMRDAALRLKRDDETRRRIAEAGWRKSHECFNERLVTRFMEETIFRRPSTGDYAWPTRLW